jgi:bacteriocin biosynthesis cyclodehydratase domain-containing protein
VGWSGCPDLAGTVAPFRCNRPDHPRAPVELRSTIRYSQNPALTYVVVSDDEVIAKGGHLEGFSLVVSDDTGRGMAAGVLDAVRDGATADEVAHRLDGSGGSVEEISRFLADLYDSGALLRIDDREAAVADWLAFARYGQPPTSARHRPLVVAGGPVAGTLAAAVAELGLKSSHVELGDLGDLDRFAAVDEAPPEPEAPADLDRPQLVVVVEGTAIGTLYELNERAVAAGTSVLHVQVAGVEWAVGPAVVPGATACFWEFERQRARSGFSYSEYSVMTAAAGRQPPREAPLVARRATVAAATPYLVELALLGRSSLAGAVLRGRATTAEATRHSVMRLPRCPVCLPHRPMLRNLLF